MSRPIVLEMALLCTLLLAATAGMQASTGFGRLPLAFEPNQGQADARVHFLARGPGYTLFLTGHSAVLSQVALAKSKAHAAVLATRFIGALPDVSAIAEAPLHSTANYLIGSKSAWRAEIPEYARVRYRGLYPGVDLIYHGNAGALEYDFAIAPGANAAAIRFRIEGADSIALDVRGNLVLRTAFGALVQRRPLAYQTIRGRRRPVRAGFLVRGDVISFRVGKYDPRRELVIDPSLVYATYFARAGSATAQGAAVDSTGHLYLVGYTSSTSFPTKTGSYATTFRGGYFDAFLVKLTKAGDGRIYSTYLGGSQSDIGNAVAVDAAGDAYVTGNTTSDDFPGTFIGSSHDTGVPQAFVIKLNEYGTAIIYAARFGGNDAAAASDVSLGTIGKAIAVDEDGHAHVVGGTTSTLLPVTPGAFQSNYQGGLQLEGSGDGFAAVLSSNGTSFLMCTYLGSPAFDAANAVATDAAENTYAAGITWGVFPSSPGVVHTPQSPESSGWIAKLNTSGGRVWSTMLGGSDQAQVNALTVDAGTNVYAAGSATTADFPTTTGAYNRTSGGGFVLKLNPTATSLIYSTFLGPGGAAALKLDRAGDAYVFGTAGLGFPTTPDALQKTFGGGGDDTFVTVLNPTGRALLYSTYYGGNGDDTSAGGGLDPANNIYLAGNTSSTNLPFKGGWQSTPGALFMAKLSALGTASPPGCQTPVSSPSIYICAPGNNSTVSSPVKISASLRWDGHTIAASKVYVDGTNRYTGAKGQTSIDISVSVATGNGHRLTIRMWDTVGNNFAATEYFNVK